MDEEIAETESSLDEKEEESDEQKEEEWRHPCLPPNESNSLTPTLYECYDPMYCFEISLFDEVDAFSTYGLDATMDDACGTPGQRTGTPHVPAQRSSLLAHGTA